jgi:phospholipase C
VVEHTVFIVNFDEWGGFFEHVPPPRAQAANGVDPDIVDGKTLLGMRVPVVVASPWSAEIRQIRSSIRWYLITHRF